MIAPNYPKVDNVLLPAFMEVASNLMGWREGKYADYQIKMVAPREIILHKTGQKILCYSANKWRDLVGENISHFSATEVAIYNNNEWLAKCLYRLRCPRAELRQYMIESVPEGTEDYFAQIANFGTDEALRDGVYLDEENNRKRYILFTEDNEHLPKGYVDTVREATKSDPGRCESYLKGLFVPFTKGTAYWEFRHSACVKLGWEKSARHPINFCWDFNANPLAWKAIQRLPSINQVGERIYKFVELAEASGKARGLMDACVEFMAAFPPARFKHVPIHIWGDPTGFHKSHKAPNCDFDQIYNILKAKYHTVEIKAPDSAPQVRARLERVNQLFAYDLIVVCAWMQNSIKSYANTGLKDGTWQIEKPQGEDWTHWADAGGYYYHEVTKHLDLEDPISPRIYGVNKLL